MERLGFLFTMTSKNEFRCWRIVTVNISSRLTARGQLPGNSPREKKKAANETQRDVNKTFKYHLSEHLSVSDIRRLLFVFSLLQSGWWTGVKMQSCLSLMLRSRSCFCFHKLWEHFCSVLVTKTRLINLTPKVSVRSFYFTITLSSQSQR